MMGLEAPEDDDDDDDGGIGSQALPEGMKGDSPSFCPKSS